MLTINLAPFIRFVYYFYVLVQQKLNYVFNQNSNSLPVLLPLRLPC